MSDKTRERAVAKAIAEQHRRRLNTFHEAQAQDALAKGDLAPLTAAVKEET